MTQMDVCFPAHVLAALRHNLRPLTDTETVILARIGRRALGVIDRVGLTVQSEDVVRAAADQIDQIAEIVTLTG